MSAKNSFGSLAKRFFASFVFACVLVGTGYAGLARVHAAAPPRIIMYQGRLLNSNSVPVSDTTASISFALYDAVSGGTCLWSNSSATCATTTARTVTLTSGLFSEPLGDTAAATPYAAIGASVFASNTSVYLQVVVNSETLTPRKQMLAAPYAVNADGVDGYDTSLVGATSSMIPVTDASGNLVITGSPQGSLVNQGSLYINPAAGVVAANEVLLGIAVGGTAEFIVDGEGDGIFTGDVNVNGGDFNSTATSFNFLNSAVTTLSMANAATILDIGNSAITSSINIGGASANGANTVNIATNSSSADTISIGNTHASTLTTITGGDDWSISSAGLITTAGDVAVNGNDITSTGVIRIVSGGSAGLILDAANGIVNVIAADDFAVGGTTLVSPFSVDESLNTVRIGDGANDTSDPTVTFYASDATDSGSLSYIDEDRFTFTGGNISFVGLGSLPATASTVSNELYASSAFSGTSSASLNVIEMYGLGSVSTYSAIENATGTDHYVGAANNQLTISGGTATITRGFGSRNRLTNTSTNGSLLQGSGYLSAVEAEFEQSASATTLATAYGVHSVLTSSAGTITSGSAISGEVLTSAGTITTAYAGRFLATSSGTNRYGVYGEASGGTTNYSGYFTGAQLQVDGDSTPDTPGFATGAGDLFVGDSIEVDGSTRFGDTTGTDDFVFDSSVTTTTLLQVLGASLTSGTGVYINRANDGTATTFTGKLLNVQQSDVSAGSGSAVDILQNGTGSSVGLYITQANTSAHVANATGNNALVIDIGEAGSSDNAIIMRSAVPSSTDTEFRVTTAGDAFVDGAFTGGGADFAEYFATADSALGDRDLVCQDESLAKNVKRCEAGNTRIVGVISTNPAFIGNNIGDGTEDLHGNPKYRLVGLNGQVDTKVSVSGGAIAVGDPISTSSTLAGYGAKAHGPVRIVGFALQPLASGTGVIRVLVNPQWYGEDVLTATGSATQIAGSFAIAAATAATASSTAVDSGALSLRGSVWSAGAAQSVGMSIKTAVNAVDDYRLSITNTSGTEVASVGSTGDFAIAGRLYPSDRGASQKNKYIYYDGSSGSGGDLMRTNSAGWATGSYDFAEMFPSNDVLVPGEVVVFGDANEQVKRSTGEQYSRTIAGIVSTRPGFLAGENRVGDYPIALAGRVPTLVSTENGAINIGDPLTTSSRPGYAMKATEPGPILGYAAESFAGSAGTVIVYVNVSYYSGAPVAEGPAAENSISHLAQDIENFDTAGTLNFNGGQLLAIGSMTSASGAWRLEGDGDIITSGRLIQLVKSAQGVDVETYAATSRQMTVQISGTVTLANGRANVHFADIDSSFIDIIDTQPTYRALVTPYGATGALYVTNRTADGFSIVESGAASDGVSVDWLVIATRRDYAEAPSTIEQVVPVITPNASVGGGSGAVAPDLSETPSDVLIAPDVDTEPIANEITPPDVVSDTASTNGSLGSGETSETVVDAPVASDAGSDTVVSDAPAAEASAPAPSADSSSGEASL